MYIFRGFRAWHIDEVNGEMAIFSEGWDVVGFDGVEPMDAGKAQSGMENLGTFVVKGWLPSW